MVREWDSSEPTHLSPEEAEKTMLKELPENCLVEVSRLSKDNYFLIELEGTIARKGQEAFIYMSHDWYRKYWDYPLGMAFHMDLMKRLLEFRQSEFKDISDIEFNDEGDWCHLNYTISIGQVDTIGEAFKKGLKVSSWIENIVNDAQEKTGKLISNIAENYSQFKLLEIPNIIEKIETEEDSNLKGRALEELAYKLFESIKGFEVVERLKTDTEEIDLVILNKSDNPFWQKESQLILVECKNWSSKCGKNELVCFKEKITNRRGRAKIGFFISWGGFASTFSKEDLRSSQGDILIVPIDGKSLKSAIENESFPQEIEKWWLEAVGA